VWKNKSQRSNEDNAKNVPIIGSFWTPLQLVWIVTASDNGENSFQYFRKRNSCPKGLSTCPLHFAFVGHNLKVSHCHRLLRSKIYEQNIQTYWKSITTENFTRFFASKLHFSRPAKAKTKIELDFVKYIVLLPLPHQKFERPQCINTLRTGSIKLFKRTFPGFLTILTL